MQLRHLGYACQNVTLDCTTGRTFRLASLSPERADETIAMNLDGLMEMLRWNLEQGIHFLRISSDVVPFASHAAFPYDWRRRFENRFAEIRRFVEENGVRLSMHPGQYTVLNSNRPDVVDSAVEELEYHASFLEAVAPRDGTMTLHVGGAYGDKPSAMERFKQNVERLSLRARGRLTIENDDKVYHLDDVLPLCEELGLPLVFDYFHHQCHFAGASYDEGLTGRLERVVATWKGAVPKFHLSSRKPGSRTSHADYVLAEDLDAFLGVMELVGGPEPFDLMLEAKYKDRAVLELMHYLKTGEAPERQGAMAAADEG